MKKIEKDFLALLRNCLHDKNEMVNCELGDLVYMAKSHICIPFIYIGAKKSDIEIPDFWKEYMAVFALKNQQNMSVQGKIIKKLLENGITCAVIKGTSVSVNYKEPIVRTLGDIDILVRPSDYDMAIKLVCGNDCKDESSEDHKFHFKYTIDGVAVEIHKYVTEYTDDAYGAVTEAFMEKALDDVEFKRIDEFEFPVLKNNFQAATLLLHIQRHFFENRLPIRMLCDWAMFIQNVDKNEWDDSIYPFISKMGLNPLSDALTTVCNKYLGNTAFDKVGSSVSDKLVESLMLEFINGGVIKEEDSLSRSIGSSYSQNRLNSKGKIVPLFMLLNEIARNEFSIARKSKVFLPLFWIYIPIRYFVRFMTGKRKRISLSSFNETAERKEYILRKLKLND